jgi:predicted DCC family thiol-disulfide oxidoreductase YuxK
MPAVTLFFDGACPVCSREARHYRKILDDQQLGLVDIAAADFDARKHGLDPDAVHRSLHAKLADGRVVKGIDAFAPIWDQIPRYRWLSSLTRLPVSRQAMQLGYVAFASVRPYLPGRSCSVSCSSAR